MIRLLTKYNQLGNGCEKSNQLVSWLRPSDTYKQDGKIGSCKHDNLCAYHLPLASTCTLHNMTVEMSERAQSLLDELMNVGIIRDMVFAHVKDKKQLKELAALSKTYMPSVVKSLWLNAREEKFVGLRKMCASVSNLS